MFKISSKRWAHLICLAAFLAGAWALLLKYYFLSYYDWDLAFFSQATWNLCYGSQYTSLVGINYFGDHSYYFTFLILPIFALFPHPLTLLFLKLTAFVLSAYVFYRIIRNDHQEWVAVVLMAVYLIFPSNVFALLYEFNPEAFAPVFLFLVYDFFRREKYVPFVIASVFLCLIKENMPLVIFMFGAFALLTKKKDPVRWGWGPMIASMLTFLTLVFWIIPLFRQMPQHAFWVRYQHILENPIRFLLKVVTGNIGYVTDLFGPLLVPVMIAPQNLFFMLPVFGQHIFSNEVAEHTIFYHYGSAMTPFIFLAASAGLAKAGKFLKRKAYMGMIILLILFSIGHVWHFVPAMKSRLISHKGRLNAERWDMIKSIPAEAAVVATFDFLPPLSLRKSLYSFHMLYDDFYQDASKLKKGELFKNKVFELPADVDYALIDLNDPFLMRAVKEKPDAIGERVDAFLKDWQVIRRQGSVVLLRKLSSLSHSNN